MADDRAAIAHLLRRTTFGPFPGQVDALDAGGLPAALDGVLGATPPPLPPDPVLDSGDGERPPEWWFRRMRDPAVGLHEKMVWFWHSHLTSSVDKVGQWRMMWNQHLLLRQHALGNFRTHVAGDDHRPGDARLPRRRSVGGARPERELRPGAPGAVHDRRRQRHRGQRQGRREGPRRVGRELRHGDGVLPAVGRDQRRR